MKRLIFILATVAAISSLSAATTSSTTSAPSSQSQVQPTPPPAPPPPPSPFKPLPKPVLPPMPKPFGMPGVVGLQNGKWAGTDYLGFVSNYIGVNVEILKGENVPAVPDESLLEARVAEIFRKAEITPQSEATQGPPLPFVHVLLIIYPVARDQYVIFGACRLFENIEVLRKNFKPAGYWQGITWETQNVMLASQSQLDDQINAMVDGLATAFSKRYRMYNPTNPIKSKETPQPLE